MEVQVGSPLPQVDDVMAMSTDLSIESEQDNPVTLEVSGADAGTVMPTETVAVEDAIPDQAPEGAVVTSADVGIPMGVML